jgi:hypothetical protein
VEVAVELPFTIVFEPPSRSELRALLRMRGPWAAGLIIALTIGAVYLLASVARVDARAAAGAVPLNVTSTPSGARVWVDGHEQGIAPSRVAVEPGAHDVVLKTADGLEGRYSLDVGRDGQTFDAVLWRKAPTVTHLRPTLPGAVLSDVRLLDTGELGLVMSLPPGQQVEAWSLDPRGGSVQLIMHAMPGARLAFAPDGRHLAYLGPDVGPPRAASDAAYDSSDATDQALRNLRVLWLFNSSDSTSSPDAGWRAPLEATEHLVDVSWSPQADQLLVVASRPLPGGARRSRAWFVAADGRQAEPAVTLPSDVAPGTATWSPDGSRVGFIAHAGQVNALCLLSRDGSFRYLADLDPSPGPPLAAPSLSWSSDGQRILFVAPRQRTPGTAFDWLAPSTQHAVFEAALDQGAPTLIVDNAPDDVTWREDGQMLGLGRAGPDAPLGIRVLNRSGTRSQDLVQLPLKPGRQYTATWDLPHAQVLVMSRGATTGNNDFWLVRLGMEERP